MAVLTCPKCGYENGAEANFCYQCGNRLRPAPALGSSSPPGAAGAAGAVHNPPGMPAVAAPAQARPKPRLSPRMAFWGQTGLGLAAFLVYLALLGYLFYRLDSSIFENFSLQASQARPANAALHASARELDRLTAAAAQFVNPAGVEKTVVLDEIAGRSLGDGRVATRGTILRKVKVENLLEAGWPSAVMLEVGGSAKSLLVLYRGYTGSLQTGDPVEVHGYYLASEKVIHAYQINKLEQNPFVETWRNTWILRAAMAVAAWMVFCALVYLWRSQRYLRSLANLAVFAAAVLSALSLSGCEIHFTTTIRADGSGAVSTQLTESAENMNFLRQVPSMAGYLDAWAQSLRGQGILVDHTYLKASEEITFQRRFGSLAEFLKQGAESADQSSWVYVSRYTEGGETIYRYTALVDTRDFYKDVPGVNSSARDMILQEFNKISMQYSVILPGKIYFHNGAEMNGDAVTFKIPMNAVSQVVVESRAPAPGQAQAGGWTIYIAAAVLALIFLVSTALLLTALIGYRLPKRKQP
jgi:hypothetical protein